MGNIPVFSPPSTGGDEGEGAQLVSITPTLTLPRQGGGKYKETPQQRLWGIENLINFNQIIFLGIFILAILLAYRLILYTESQLLLLLGGALAVISIAWRPISLALGLGYKHSEPDAGSAIHKVQVSTLHIK